MYRSAYSTRFFPGISTPITLGIALLLLTLSLALLVTQIGADDPHHALATHDLAALANPFHRCPDFHLPTSAFQISTISPRDMSNGDMRTRMRAPGVQTPPVAGAFSRGTNAVNSCPFPSLARKARVSITPATSASSSIISLPRTSGFPPGPRPPPAPCARSGPTVSGRASAPSTGWPAPPLGRCPG